MNRPKLLWISYRAPYDCVAHAGGRIHNYYIKGLHSLDSFDITLLSFAYTFEMEKIDTANYGIHSIIEEKHTYGFLHWINAIENRLHKMNFLSSDGGFVQPIINRTIKRDLKSLISEGYKPDIIILHWTQIVLCIDSVKNIFKNVPIVAIEEDVGFQAMYRKVLFESIYLKKKIKSVQYKKLKEMELASLKKCEMVILNNNKDLKLLTHNGVGGKKWVWSPFFSDYSGLQYKGGSNDILFFGAMDREENWRSAIWFIDNVMCLLDDYDVRFVVIGNKPNRDLYRYANDRIVIKGYVDSIDSYLCKGMCLVAPLVMGAGVKIKVLEAMSSGIPVLTNEIGIEGISAQDERDFFLCTKPIEYAERIIELLEKKVDVLSISANAKKLIQQNYNSAVDLAQFDKLLRRIAFASMEGGD